MKERGPSRPRPRDAKQIADDAERRALQDKMRRGHALTEADQKALNNMSRGKMRAEPENDEYESTNEYRKRFPKFETFFSALGRISKEVLAVVPNANDKELRKFAEKFGRQLNLLSKLPADTPIYVAILDTIISDCTMSEKDSEETAKRVYEQHINKDEA